MRKIVSLLMCFLLLATSISWANTTALNSQLQNVKDKAGAISSEIKNKQAEVSSINETLATLEAKIAESTNKIADMEVQIQVYTQNIQLAEEDIVRLEDKIVVNTDLLGERINVMYKQGDVAYIEILLNSKDFGELLSNFNVIRKIVSYDRQLLKELGEVKQTIATRKVEMEESKVQVTALKKELEETKLQLQADEKAQQENKTLLAADIDKLELQEDQLLKEAKALESEIKALAAKSSMGSTYSGGVMGWPLAITGTITSSFGYRIHPIYKTNKMHTGIDIAAPKGTKVLASAAGEVIFSGYSGSYGNMVMIDHGGGIVTLYAHNSSLNVSKGTKVSRGTVVALVGSTGASTGNHLHFEVRVNGKYVDPRKYV